MCHRLSIINLIISTRYLTGIQIEFAAGRGFRAEPFCFRSDGVFNLDINDVLPAQYQLPFSLLDMHMHLAEYLVVTVIEGGRVPGN